MLDIVYDIQIYISGNGSYTWGPGGREGDLYVGQFTDGKIEGKL